MARQFLEEPVIENPAFFKRPKYVKNAGAYENKQVNPRFYCMIKIGDKV